MNKRIFKFEEDKFSKTAQSISKVYHELLLLMKFLQTKPRIKKMIFTYYVLYYTVIRNTDDKGSVKKK